MVYKHIVMWKFKVQHNGKSALENARWMKEQLEGLVGVVPELLSAAMQQQMQLRLHLQHRENMMPAWSPPLPRRKR